jgi:hypothetical protein
MKAYDLGTRFTFGKYEGKTLEDVFQQDPAYVEKCLLTVEDFAIDEKSVQKLFEKFPDVDISDAAIDTNLDKLDAIEMEDGEFLFAEEGYDEEDMGDDSMTDDDTFGDDEDIDDDDFEGEDDLFDEDETDEVEDDWSDEEDFR